MPSVALIGPDGAGKTTLTRMLAASRLVPFKYLYMGIDIPRGDLALPTSRLARRLKARPGRAPDSARARVRAFARLGHRMAEEWFRQLVSWSYQLRGFVVLYDRHYVFDFAPELTANRIEPFDRRVHSWCLRYLYPRPDLVIFLDAPGDLLFARKGESTVEELERRRQAFLRVGERTPNFVRVDATRPVMDVYAEVVLHVIGLCAGGRDGTATKEVAR